MALASPTSRVTVAVWKSETGSLKLREMTSRSAGCGTASRAAVSALRRPWPYLGLWPSADHWPSWRSMRSHDRRRTSLTSCQRRSGFRASTSAATPAAPGQALEVPPKLLV